MTTKIKTSNLEDGIVTLNKLHIDLRANVANIGTSSGGGGYVQNTAPNVEEVNAGSIWVDTRDGNQYVLIDDGDSKQWVEIGSTLYNLDNTYATVSFVSAEVSSLNSNLTNYVDTSIANLVDSAPSTLNTLNELSAALNDDNNFATTTVNLINTKASTGKAIAMAIVFGG